ncbi:hypothetical protein AKO1_008455 [Acrasis kona]|uniref:Uncharacterized protein n=1 Tax=Acrasis kona TaxID=1008807 RepID=A0AAW2YPY5_9EUKA
MNTEQDNSPNVFKQTGQMITTSIRDSPLVSKGFMLALCIFYAGSFVPFLRELFVMKPGSTVWDLYIWNIFTNTYVETHILSLLFSITGVAASSVWLLQSPLQAQQNSFTIIPWSKGMYFKFIIIVNILISIISFLLALIIYSLLKNENLLNEEYNGFHGCLSGFTVVLKQQLPEQQFSILNIYVLRGKHIPFLCIVVGAVHGVFVGQVTDFLYLVLGVYVAWFYLRFFQLHDDDGTRGDHADSFSFVSFFPSSLQPYVANFANYFHLIACRIGLVKKIRIMSPLTPSTHSFIAPTSSSTSASNSRKLERQNNSAPVYQPTLKPSDDVSIDVIVHPTNTNNSTTSSAGHQLSAVDAQRRRELAQKALEKRMASKAEAAVDTAPTTTKTEL